MGARSDASSWHQMLVRPHLSMMMVSCSFSGKKQIIHAYGEDINVKTQRTAHQTKKYYTLWRQMDEDKLQTRSSHLEKYHQQMALPTIKLRTYKLDASHAAREIRNDAQRSRDHQHPSELKDHSHATRRLTASGAEWIHWSLIRGRENCDLEECPESSQKGSNALGLSMQRQPHGLQL